MIQLQRMPRKQRKRLEADLAWFRYSPTEQGLTDAVVDNVRSVRTVTWHRGAPGMVIASLRMRWWAWLGFGIIHALALRRARQIVDRHKAAGSSIYVFLW